MSMLLEFTRSRSSSMLMGHASGKRADLCRPLLFSTVNERMEKPRAAPLDNAKTNNTQLYKAVYGAYPSCVLRRGNLFKVGVRFSQFFEMESVPLQAIFTVGKRPSERDGTLVTLAVPNTVDREGRVHETTDHWTVSVSFHSNDMMVLKFRSPSRAPVGKWSMSLKLGDGEVRPAKTPIYIICNPWLPGTPNPRICYHASEPANMRR
ncbi:hypothetical protein HPB48_020174 [Haemaphysalis longicornis]|uniref:Transglutaminase N-terminal domain-containing protein n=1 Tax=Haemaphysalis longicornis TaxID=44386 RepID=A0A9J6FJ19_HAELO|nr:hypothetical protein HPB48_020174 [Haemaphysalis longicornis]